ncbi:MAG: hypothetical protein HKN21_13295, partial [Candidatus Eisenbacteria bacterium]|nr:hypothetical protein [Candidatus Eisenbacteria bacterium]
MQFRALGVTAVLSLAFVCLASTAFAQPAKLLFSQVEVRGSVSNADFDEYVVIKNPGSSAVDLSNVYLTDATFANGDQYYYNLPNDALPIGGGGFNDFVARFPDGAMIGPGEEITISLIGSDSFESTYGISPHYELYEDGSSADNIPDMREARPGSLVDNTSQLPGLSNSGEVIVLFYWDGASDLVTDLDYVVWGDKNEAVDKTGISIDGPDGGSDATAYANDTSVSSQDGLGASPTGTFIRVDDNEGSQASSGSNGVGGRDETSENLTATFTSNTDGVPPGQVPEDTTPPTLLSASGAAGNSNVDLLFSEGLGAGATTTSNYSVFPTASPGSPIAVTAAETGGDPSTVNLTLASSLETGTSYTVEVTGVQDMAGNTLVGTATALFNTGVGDGFAVVAAFPFGPSHIGVAFSQDVNASQATNTANYTVTFGGSGATISSIQLQDNGSTAILNFSSPLPQNTAIQVTAANITSSTGGSLESGGPFAFNTGSETIVGIDQVHADVGSLEGQTVTVYGQVYMPATVQGSQISGYIQDGTGRGLNIFDFTTTVPTAVSDRGTVVKLTGEVDLFFTTVEVIGFTATEVASGIPAMSPRVLSVGEAAGPQWEGTYIQTTST